VDSDLTLHRPALGECLSLNRFKMIAVGKHRKRDRNNKLGQ